MKAKIIDQDDQGIGVRVTDNNNQEHTVAVGFDGEVQGHSQDGYPDAPSKRTNREDELVHQARLYAKWYVYQNTDSDTVEPRMNPDRIAATLLAIREMDDDEFERHFGTLARQFQSYGDGSIDRPIDLEDAIPPNRTVIYKQDVYLDATIEDVRGLHEDFAEGAGDFTAAVLDRLKRANVFSALADKVDEMTDFDDDLDASEPADLPNFALERVSDPYYMYHRDNQPARTVGAEETDDDPDTVIEMIPTEHVDSLAVFRAFLVHHLVCQIRDTFHGMGLEPPAAYRMLGTGVHKYTLKYKHFEMYPEYFDTEAAIDGYGYV